MSPARPGFLSAFVPSFGRALKNSLPGKRGLILLLVLAIPPAIALLATSVNTPGHHGSRELADVHMARILMMIVLYLFLQLLVPLGGLLFGTVVIMHEASSGNLPYLFTRPAPRIGIVLGRYFAVLLVGYFAIGLSLVATLAVLSDSGLPDGFAGRALLTLALALPAYVAAFAALSVFTRWALVTGFLYTFGVEGIIGQIPGNLREGTLLYYTRSLIGGWDYRFGFWERIFGPSGAPVTMHSVTVLLVVTAIALVLLCVLTSRREFAAKEQG